MPGPLSRRTAMLLGAGATGLVIAGCEDSSPPGKPSGGSSHGGRTTPTRDPAEVAALRAAAGSLQQLVTRYDAVVRRHPPLRARLAGPRKLHTAHLARLRSLGGVPAATTSTAKAVPAKAAAALAELASTEQRLTVAHATAAAQRSGEAARLLAMIAASQTQIAVALRRKAA
jgi:hypothetical protein